MRVNRLAAAMSLAVSLSITAQALAMEHQDVRHVLLISVDGMHALDVARYIESHPNSTLKQLARHGITYSNARTPANSDSFPGLLALVTGGSPVTSGLFYDVSYDRSYFANGDSTCSGIVNDPAPGASHSAGKGSAIAFDESIDLYGTDPVTGLPLSRNVINPNSLPYQIDSKPAPAGADDQDSGAELSGCTDHPLVLGDRPKGTEVGARRRHPGPSGPLISARCFRMERAMGIEPTLAAWEAAVLPLNYTR